MIGLAIEKELLASQAVDSHLIDVRVEDGIVTLSGRVNNLLAKIAVSLAQRVRGVLSVGDQVEVNPVERRVARYTIGVRRVKNHLHVRSADEPPIRNKWKPKSDAAIEADLKEKLSFIFVDEDNHVTAKVSNGVALLEGSVDTWFMWQTALDQAIAAGAREPHMMIRVRYGLPGGSRYYGPNHYIPR